MRQRRATFGQTFAVWNFGLAFSAAVSYAQGQPLAELAKEDIKIGESILSTQQIKRLEFRPTSFQLRYLEKRDHAWVFIPKRDLTDETTERIAVGQLNGEVRVWLAADPPQAVSTAESKRGPGTNDRFECFFGVLSSAKRQADTYSICASSFIKSDTSAREAATGGLNILIGTVRKMMRVDTDALRNAVLQSGLLEEINASRRAENEAWLARYRALQANATSKQDLQRLIEMATASDPDLVRSTAIERLAELNAQENAARAEQERIAIEKEKQAQLLLRQQQLAAQKAEEEQRLAAQRAAEKAMETQRKQDEIRLQRWRQTLARGLVIGDDTFCGPVVEVRKPMYKIATRAQIPGYASEVWLKQSEIYPPEWGCTNINGRLTPQR